MYRESFELYADHCEFACSNSANLVGFHAALGQVSGGELEQEAISLTLKLERRLWEPAKERDEILWRIQEIGPQARAAVPALLKLLEQERPRSVAKSLEGSRR